MGQYIMSQYQDIATLSVAARQLVAALDAHDSDGILVAITQLQAATHAVAAHGAWAGQDMETGDAPPTLKTLLQDIVMQIDAATYRVRFLTDFARQRLDILTQASDPSQLKPVA